MLSFAHRLFALLSLGVLLGLAGCGSSSTASTPATPVITVTPTRAHNGCPTQLIPVDGSPRFDVLIPSPNNPPDQTVTLPVGKVLEVRLTAGIVWHLQMTDAASVLEPSQPQGWYNSKLQACIWEFAGNTAGQATLTFTGLALCPPTKACPNFAISQIYTIKVQ